MIREYIYFRDDNPNGTSGLTEEEIVRCKDCKHVSYLGEGTMGNVICCENDIQVSRYGYCSFGERKDNE